MSATARIKHVGRVYVVDGQLSIYPHRIDMPEWAAERIADVVSDVIDGQIDDVSDMSRLEDKCARLRRELDDAEYARDRAMDERSKLEREIDDLRREAS
jgi:hypothetical protein